jgi:hypothetical protein
MYGGQETANIAQRPDRVLSVSTPSRAKVALGSEIQVAGQIFKVTRGLCFVQVLKQRIEGLPAGGIFAYEYNPAEADPMKRYVLVWQSEEYEPSWKPGAATW